MKPQQFTTKPEYSPPVFGVPVPLQAGGCCTICPWQGVVQPGWYNRAKKNHENTTIHNKMTNITFKQNTPNTRYFNSLTTLLYGI